MLSCTAQGAVAGDLWPSQGPGMLWGTGLGSQAQHGQTQRCGTVLPVPELLQPQHLLHSGSSWMPRRPSRASSCSHPGSGGVCSHTQPSCAKDRPLPLGLHTPSSPLRQLFQPSQQPGFLLTITSPRCPAAPGRQRWLLRGCGLAAETCCPR